MEKLGWYLSSLQNPNGLHFCVTAVHVEIPDFELLFATELKQAVEKVISEPNGHSSEAVMYCSNQSFTTKHFVPTLVREYWNVVGQVEPLP